MKNRLESEGLSEPELSEGDVVRRLMKKGEKYILRRTKQVAGILCMGTDH